MWVQILLYTTVLVDFNSVGEFMKYLYCLQEIQWLACCDTVKTTLIVWNIARKNVDEFEYCIHGFQIRRIFSLEKHFERPLFSGWCFYKQRDLILNLLMIDMIFGAIGAEVKFRTETESRGLRVHDCFSWWLMELKCLPIPLHITPSNQCTINIKSSGSLWVAISSCLCWSSQD